MSNEQNTEDIVEVVGRIQSMLTDLERLGVVTNLRSGDDLKKVTQQRDLLAQCLWTIRCEVVGDHEEPNPGTMIAEIGYGDFATNMMHEILNAERISAANADTSPVDLSALRDLRIGLALGTVTGTPQELSLLIGRALGDVPAEVES